MLKRKGEKAMGRARHGARANVSEPDAAARHGIGRPGGAAGPASAAAVVARGVSQTNLEVAAEIVSESIGRTLAMRREARARGEGVASARLSERLERLVALRDRVRSGDEEAIGGVLAGAWS